MKTIENNARMLIKLIILFIFVSIAPNPITIFTM